MARELWKGNEAIAESAVRAGCMAYFGYPITPQSEILEYMSRRLPELGRAFVQAESELGAVNMVYGAACTGTRVMSSSSSPGISLMLEGLSYIAGTELPVVLIDVMRGGPGLGNIAPAQADYTQIVHGGGHGDYRPIVLTPATLQEAVDLVPLAFDLAEKYRSIAVVLIDGSMGQMTEPIEMPAMQPVRTERAEWATTGSEGRERRFLSSIYMDAAAQEVTNFRIMRRWQEVEANEVRCKTYYMEDAELAVVGFGTSGRVALSAVRAARAEGLKVGLIRPITVAPFPTTLIHDYAAKLKGMLVVEMNAGQMLDDVTAAVEGRTCVEFTARMGGVIPFPDEILAEIHRMAGGDLPTQGNPRDRWLNRTRTQI